MYPNPDPQVVIDQLSRTIGGQHATITQLEAMIVEHRKEIDKLRSELEGNNTPEEVASSGD